MYLISVVKFLIVSNDTINFFLLSKTKYHSEMGHKWASFFGILKLCLAIRIKLKLVSFRITFNILSPSLTGKRFKTFDT